MKKQRKVTKFMSLDKEVIEAIEKEAEINGLSFSTYINSYFKKLLVGAR